LTSLKPVNVLFLPESHSDHGCADVYKEGPCQATCQLLKYVWLRPLKTTP
jgi:hypothetical protein